MNLDDALKHMDYAPTGRSRFGWDHFAVDGLTPERDYQRLAVNLREYLSGQADHLAKAKAEEIEQRRLAVKRRQIEAKLARATDPDKAELLQIDLDEIAEKVRASEVRDKLLQPILRDSAESVAAIMAKLDALKAAGLRPFEEAEAEYFAKLTARDIAVERMARLMGVQRFDVVERALALNPNLETDLLRGDVQYHLATAALPDKHSDPHVALLADRIVNAKPGILVAMPRRSDDMPPAMRLPDGVVWPYAKKPEFYAPVGIYIPEARNRCMAEALRLDAEYLLFLDDDVLVEPDAVQRLVATADATGADLVSGVVYQKGHSIPYPMTQSRDDATGRHFVPPLTRGNGVQPVNWLVSTSCLLVRMARMHEIPAPHFNLIQTDSGGIAIGEDFYFTQKALAAGLTAVVDTDVQCLHLDFATRRVWHGPDVTPADYGRYASNYQIEGVPA